MKYEYKYNDHYRFIDYKPPRKRKNETIFLTKSENKIFKKLQSGENRTYRQLIKAVYNVEDYWLYYKPNIDSFIYNLRKKIKDIATIVGKKGEFKLEIKERTKWDD